MNLNNFNNINDEEYYYFEDECCNFSNDLKSFSKINPLLVKGLLVGSTLTAATIVSPKVRKVTGFIAKQQLKLLAGIGILSIATYISKQNDNLENTEL